MNKNAIISARILAAMSEGLDVAEALNAVLGVGAFEQLAGDLYDELQQRAA